MKKNLLPIGSVITMQDAKRKLMVIGVGVRDNQSGKAYDYVAVPYPQGYVGADRMFLCNHADIAVVNYLGFINAELQIFRAQLNEEE